MMARIVIAEDEQDIRELIAFTLKYAGHEVVTGSDGIEAVELTRIERPDLVVLDVRMPKMSGYDACLRIKADPDLAHIPVVFLSAKGQELEIEQGFNSGAAAYLLKPFAPDQLVLELNKILEGNTANLGSGQREIAAEDLFDQTKHDLEESEE
jgi:CheY-like chemotaxis protein